MSPSKPLPDDLLRDVAAIRKLTQIGVILQQVCRITLLRFAAVARVTPDHWVACQVIDEIGFGVGVGDELDLAETVCGTVQQTGVPALIEDVCTDPEWRLHPSAPRFGFRSAFSVPIVSPVRGFVGTLCAADFEPRLQRETALYTQLEVFAARISHAIDTGLDRAGA